MATKKATTTKKSSATKSANETKVVCPVCGSEFKIGEHEHTVENAVAIGKDSGLGTIVLPVSKRGEALAAAGIDASKYFSIKLPTGGEQMMKMGDDGRAVPVSADDPVIQAILSSGTVPNRSLFRRWVMSQVFHALEYDGYRGKGPTAWLKARGYKYQWEMLIEELRVQARLFGRDMENFAARNRWFDKDLCVAMARDYLKQLDADAKSRPIHKCKGVPYVHVAGKDYFVSDIAKKLIQPLHGYVLKISHAMNPQQLYDAVRFFWSACPVKDYHYRQHAGFKDAYKGMGAYATMQNLLRFHGCTFPKDNQFYDKRQTGLSLLETAASACSDGEGWRLFGLMRQMLKENGIDIKAKRAEWAAKKSPRA